MSTLNANAYQGQRGDSLFTTPSPWADILFNRVIFKRLWQNCILITGLCDYDYIVAVMVNMQMTHRSQNEKKKTRTKNNPNIFKVK